MGHKPLKIWLIKRSLWKIVNMLAMSFQVNLARPYLDLKFLES